MKRLWYVVGIFVVIIVFIVFIIITGTRKKSEEIRIGAILPLTGAAASLGEWFKTGYQFAVEDINSKGGVNGKTIQMIFEDSKDEPKEAVSAFRKLVEINKARIIVTARSPIALTLVSLADKSKIFLSADAAHPEITGKSKYVIRHSQTTDAEVSTILDFMKGKEISKIAYAGINDDFGLAMKSVINSLFKGEITEQILFNKDEIDFKLISLKLMKSDPEAIIIGGTGKGLGLLVKKLREFEYKGKIFSTILFASPDILAAAGEAAKGVYHTSFDLDINDPQYISLDRMHKEKYSKPVNSITVFGYNTILLISYAIQNVGDKPEEMWNFITKLGSFKGVGENMQINEKGDITPKLKIVEEK